MYKWLASVSLAVTPLLCAAAPQASWLSCDSQPNNFLDIEQTLDEWPVGEIVVLEGFTGSLDQDERGFVLTVLVRNPPLLSLPLLACNNYCQSFYHNLSRSGISMSSQGPGYAHKLPAEASSGGKSPADVSCAHAYTPVLIICVA